MLRYSTAVMKCFRRRVSKRSTALCRPLAEPSFPVFRDRLHNLPRAEITRDANISSMRLRRCGKFSDQEKRWSTISPSFNSKVPHLRHFFHVGCLTHHLTGMGVHKLHVLPRMDNVNLLQDYTPKTQEHNILYRLPHRLRSLRQEHC